MARSEELGTQGEELAQRYLEGLGMKLVDRNWRCKAGEIDLVMQDGSARVFVEVRLRHTTSFGEGVDTVGWQKQRKLIKAAQWYQQEANWWGDVRFDVVSITLSGTGEATIAHVAHAFTA